MTYQVLARRWRPQRFEDLVGQAELNLLERALVESGDKILILGGIPTRHAKGTNFLKIHTIGSSNHNGAE